MKHCLTQPVASSQIDATPKEMTPALTTFPAGKKVLIADDDKDIVEVLGIMLELEGYEIATISSGNVVQAVQQGQPHVVLLDIRMSGQDGREICRLLKQTDGTKDIPVVMISANHDGRVMALEAGADDFLGKPFEMDELLEKVALHAARQGGS